MLNRRAMIQGSAAAGTALAGAAIAGPLPAGTLKPNPTWRAMPNSAERVAWRYGTSYSSLQSGLRTFFGRSMNGYLFPLGIKEVATSYSSDRLLLSDQFDRIFNGPCDEEVLLASGYRVIGAALPHEAAIKGFVVTLGNSTTIRATALFHFGNGMHAMKQVSLRGGALASSLRSMSLDRTSAAPRSKDAIKAAYKRMPMLTVFFPKSTGEDVQLAREIAKHVQSIIKEENRATRSIVNIKRFKLQTAIVNS